MRFKAKATTKRSKMNQEKFKQGMEAARRIRAMRKAREAEWERQMEAAGQKQQPAQASLPQAKKASG